jgi:hypothetical protein
MHRYGCIIGFIDQEIGDDAGTFLDIALNYGASDTKRTAVDSDKLALEFRLSPAAD